jgi:hypothetical protein
MGIDSVTGPMQRVAEAGTEVVNVTASANPPRIRRHFKDHR